MLNPYRSVPPQTRGCETAYLTHPAHLALVADLKQYFEWAVADYTDGAKLT